MNHQKQKIPPGHVFSEPNNTPKWIGRVSTLMRLVEVSFRMVSFFVPRAALSMAEHQGTGVFSPRPSWSSMMIYKNLSSSCLAIDAQARCNQIGLTLKLAESTQYYGNKTCLYNFDLVGKDLTKKSKAIQ